MSLLSFILESKGDKSDLSKRLCDTKEIINASLNKQYFNRRFLSIDSESDRQNDE